MRLLLLFCTPMVALNNTFPYLIADASGSTANIYKKVNSVLYHRRPEEMFKWRNYLWHLVIAARGLALYQGACYRGIECQNFNPEDYAVGNNVIWKSFTSCSRSQQVAYNFMQV